MADPSIDDPASVDRVTWLGHATAVIDLGGRRLLVDPLLRRRARRAGRVDAVLVTHSHVDHLNRWTLRAMDRDTHLIVPRGARRFVDDLRFARVTEIEPGDAVDVGGCEVHAVPTRHDNGRWRRGDSPMCTGYVVRRDAIAVHHAGDIDFSDHAVFDDIGRRFALAATLLPIGGMLPVWWYRLRRRSIDRGIHIDPDCALDIYERLGATAMVPVHWGTLHARLGPPSMPRRRLVKVATTRGLAAGRVQVLDHGGALDLASQDVVVAQHADQADERDQDAHHGAEHAVAHRRA